MIKEGVCDLTHESCVRCLEGSTVQTAKVKGFASLNYHCKDSEVLGCHKVCTAKRPYACKVLYSFE